MSMQQRRSFAKLVAHGSALLLAASMVLAPQVQAQFIYTYTGQNFTTPFKDPNGTAIPPREYSTNENVSGFIELSALLGNSLMPYSTGVVTPVSFSFTDGLNVFTGANSTSSYFTFGTDALGNITQWFATATRSTAVTGGGMSLGVTTANTTGFQGSTYDLGGETQCGPASSAGVCALYGDSYYQVRGENRNQPGTWRLQTLEPPVTTVPEPSSMLLLGAGLVGVAFRMRRRR